MVKHVLSKKERHDEILTLLNQPGQQHNSGDLGKELSSLAQISHFYTKLMEIHEEKMSVQELLDEASQDENDEDSRLMIQECEEDITRLDSLCTRLEKNILKSIIPKDPEDFESDAILEIRAGTGGDEATLFAFELLQTYEKLIKNRGFQYEILSMGKISGAVAGVKGGLKEASISITSPGGGGNSFGGNNFSSVDYDSIDNDDLDTEDEFEDNSFLMELGPYGFFKYESGVHRVQRVPVNDVRIHTSACSVAVLPSNNNKNKQSQQDQLPPAELKIDTFRASGAGGQHVNTTESAIRITHLPTNISVAIQDERSQHQNKAKAMKLITAKVLHLQREEELRKRGELKSSLMGGGDRSERIRTYNFPQDRITDHRCNHSIYGISKFMGGGKSDESGGGGNTTSGGLVGSFAPKIRHMYKEDILREIEDET
eukprot:CAMPEP_0178958998 /NCGR_PEP_ID=MMETSP0789-20121207/11995_1 /TAXON_ID=3005 /ORGANISM="Rhizosolenia setigera, Strain CCMP 1694" /LENGTH=428 /DNA_ID=CAMNT_0020641849 /DNA_START=220 /DNA_END=1506 /DNA_ORIENTATION=-